MPLQPLYLETDSLRIGANQFITQANAVFVGNTLTVNNTLYLGTVNGPGGSQSALPTSLSPFGAQNKLVLAANSPTPTAYGGAIDLRVNSNGGRVGITFDSFLNTGSDIGYIYYYDDLPGYANASASERGTLLLGVQNDGFGGAEDQVAIESSGHIYLNPGISTSTQGVGSWSSALGNLYVGNNSVRYLVLHEGITAATTLRSNMSVTSGANAIAFTNGTSNYIAWNTSGVAAPSVTTRSAGTKLLLYPNISSTQVDYAIGMESSHMWFSVDNTGAGFKWYANTTNILTANTTGIYPASNTVSNVLGATTRRWAVNATTADISGNITLGTTTISANGGVGTAGQVLTSGASGNVYWGSAPTPAAAGSNTQVQFNLSGTITGANVYYVAGNTGFGNTAPNATVQVQGTANVSGVATFSDIVSLQGRTIKYTTESAVAAFAANTWVNLGRFQNTGNGDTVKITFAAGRGFNGSAGQHGETVITLRGGNGTGTNLSGTFYNIGQSQTIRTVKMKSVNTLSTDTHWDIFAEFSSYVGQGVYKVETAGSATWTHSLSSTTDPGAANSTLLIATNEFALSPSTALVLGGGAVPISNTVGQAFGSAAARWAITASTGDFSGNVSLGQDLTVTGNTSVTGFVNVVSTANIGGILTARANVVANGQLIVANTISVGNTTITGFVNVSSTANVGGIANFRNNVIANGTLTVANTAALGNTTVTGFANVTGNIVIGGTISANGGTGTAGYVLTSGGTGNAYWATATGGATIAVSDTAPGSPTANSLWWDSSVGVLRIYYNDGDTSQWVDAVPQTSTLQAVTAGGNTTTIAVGLANTTITGFANVSSTLDVAGLSTLSTANVTGLATLSTANATGQVTFNANVVLGTTTISANGGVGTSGQVLTSGASGNVYWTTPSSGISTGKAIAMAIVFGG